MEFVIYLQSIPVELVIYFESIGKISFEFVIYSELFFNFTWNL